MLTQSETVDLHLGPGGWVQLFQNTVRDLTALATVRVVMISVLSTVGSMCDSDPLGERFQGSDDLRKPEYFESFKRHVDPTSRHQRVTQHVANVMPGHSVCPCSRPLRHCLSAPVDTSRSHPLPRPIPKNRNVRGTIE